MCGCCSMLSHNELVSIPYSISQLTNLHTLTLDNNQITSAGLAQEVFRLPNLEDLWLHSNSLTMLPDTVHQATNLQVRCLRCCLAQLIMVVVSAVIWDVLPMPAVHAAHPGHAY